MPQATTTPRPGRCQVSIAAVLASLIAAAVWLGVLPEASAQPVAPIRVIAEWEPAIGTLIRYPLGIPQSLVVELAQDDLLFVLVTGPSVESQARATFNSWGIDPAKVFYIHAPVETVWTRDWGPHQIFDGNGIWSILDPIFQGYPWVGAACVPITSPGGHQGDDAVNMDVAAYFNAPLHSFPGYLVGGNFIVDGHASAFSTCMMVSENNQLWTEAEFLQLAEAYLGITHYHVVNNTENNGIQHIDCWFKALDDETLLVKRAPPWHEEYPRIETNVALLEQAVNRHGRPYRIVRIDCPAYSGSRIAAYTNALILNRKVLVPLFNTGGDAQALQTYRDAMPGYDVIGFPWGSWYYYDALHCRTRAVFDRHMLRIVHARMDSEVPAGVAVHFTALVDDRSETGLLPDSPRLVWRVGGDAEWQEAVMTATGDTDTYEAFLPGMSGGASIEYYIAAEDNSGRSETMPRTAPDGFHTFQFVDMGLRVHVLDAPERVAPWTLSTVTVAIDEGPDALVPGSVVLHYSFDGEHFVTEGMTEIAPLVFEATVPRLLCEDAPSLFVSAQAEVGGARYWPMPGPQSPHPISVGAIEPVELFFEDFEAGLPAGWIATGLWHVTGACAGPPVCDGGSWAYYGRDATCTYNNGARNFGSLFSPSIGVPAIPAGGTAVLSFCQTLMTEDEPGYDIAGVYLNGGLIQSPPEMPSWEHHSFDITAQAGADVSIEWRFDTVDDEYNDFRGWQVDAVRIEISELACPPGAPCEAGDFDCDGRIDLADFAAFFDCMAGPDATPAPTSPTTPRDCLLMFDFDSDGDVDLADAIVMQGSFDIP